MFKIATIFVCVISLFTEYRYCCLPPLSIFSGLVCFRVLHSALQIVYHRKFGGWKIFSETPVTRRTNLLTILIHDLFVIKPQNIAFGLIYNYYAGNSTSQWKIIVFKRLWGIATGIPTRIQLFLIAFWRKDLNEILVPFLAINGGGRRIIVRNGIVELNMFLRLHLRGIIAPTGSANKSGVFKVQTPAGRLKERPAVYDPETGRLHIGATHPINKDHSSEEVQFSELAPKTYFQAQDSDSGEFIECGRFGISAEKEAEINEKMYDKEKSIDEGRVGYTR